MRLQDISGIAAGFIARSARVDVGNDRHARTVLRDRLFEAFDAILNARHFGFVNNRHAAALADASQINVPA